jgi:hypothetical protein
MMHPYMSQQLARQKQDELKRTAEIAWLAASNRQTRRRGLLGALRMMRARRREAVAPATELRDRHSPDRFTKGATSFSVASSSPIKQS